MIFTEQLMAEFLLQIDEFLWFRVLLVENESWKSPFSDEFGDFIYAIFKWRQLFDSEWRCGCRIVRSFDLIYVKQIRLYRDRGVLLT